MKLPEPPVPLTDDNLLVHMVFHGDVFESPDGIAIACEAFETELRYALAEPPGTPLLELPEPSVPLTRDHLNVCTIHSRRALSEPDGIAIARESFKQTLCHGLAQRPGKPLS